jgi:hypothetical protein
MFRAVPLPITRSFPLYIRHWYMLCRFDDSFQALVVLESCHQSASVGFIKKKRTTICSIDNTRIDSCWQFAAHLSIRAALDRITRREAGGMKVGNVVITWVGNARLHCTAFSLQIDFQYHSVLSKPDTSPLPLTLCPPISNSASFYPSICVCEGRQSYYNWTRGRGVLHPYKARMNLAYYAPYMSWAEWTNSRKDVSVPSAQWN